MKIKVLGTVAPYCKDNKNGPGYLVESKQNKILLDCGNGITSCLNMKRELDNLTIIISHVDWDHFGDLLSLANTVDLYHKFGYVKNKVKIYVPKPTHKYEEEIINCKLIKCIAQNHYFSLEEYDENTKIKLDDTNIKFYKTKHPYNTYAAKIEDQSGVFVYSADTGYEDGIANFATKSNIFLCEASFLKGQIRNINTHLYAYEAGKIAKKANVGQLILTHFWPEISKDEYVREAKTEFENILAAEEGKVYTLKRSDNNGK